MVSTYIIVNYQIISTQCYSVCSAVYLTLLKIVEHLHLEASWLAHRTSVRRSFAQTPKLAQEDWDLSHVEYVEVDKELTQLTI